MASTIVMALTAGLAGCAGQALPRSLLSGARPGDLASRSPPVAVYTAVARQIRFCWLAAKKPVLKGHVFYAETPRANNIAEARITINTIARDGRRGLKAYAVDFNARRKGTVVKTHNFRFSPALAAQLDNDVRRWVAGGGGCSPISPLRGPSFARPRHARG